jgi:hypothetical protein
MINDPRIPPPRSGDDYGSALSLRIFIGVLNKHTVPLAACQLAGDYQIGKKL